MGKAVLRWCARSDGQAMVETALLLPMLVFVLIGGSDLARGYALQLAVQNGARAGAEAYALSQAPSMSLAQSAAMAETNRTPGMNVVASQVTVNPNLKSDGTACLPPTTLLQPCYVTVRIQYTFKTVIPWPIIPNTANFDRSTTMRQIN